MLSSTTESKVQLLKLLFQKRQLGEKVWSLGGMSSLDIKPDEGATSDFFAIKDEPVIFQPSTIGPTSYFLGQSIVPIVAHVHGESVLRCIGTGFFISCSGLLITAAHVITDPIERQYGGVRETGELTWRADELNLGVMIRLNPIMHGCDGYLFRTLEWASFLAKKTDHPIPIKGIDLRLNSDIAICKVEPIASDVPHQPLCMIQPGLVGTGMKEGKTAIAVGYGAMKDVELQSVASNAISGDFQFGFHASVGEILERFPDNASTRQATAPGACFSASMKLPGGMSGSPIFDREGIYVHGVVSKGWIDEEGVAPLGYGSMLAEALHIPIEMLGGKTLLQLHKEAEHGFPKLQGPGL